MLALTTICLFLLVSAGASVKMLEGPFNDRRLFDSGNNLYALSTAPADYKVQVVIH